MIQGGEILTLLPGNRRQGMSRHPNVLRPELIQDGNTRRSEPEPNPEEERQPTPPDEIDGEEECEDGSASVDTDAKQTRATGGNQQQ